MDYKSKYNYFTFKKIEINYVYYIYISDDKTERY